MEKIAPFVLILVLIAVALLSELFTGQETDWKRGRVYHRLVCTSCHIESIGEAISPMDKTIAEWTDYYEAGKHGGTSETGDLAFYVSEPYRQSIAHYNLAAEKYMDLTAQQLQADVLAFAVRGAKDSDTPMRCQ
ncbi:MAG: hypothetical protein V7754_06845 [Halioglobus sp.]